MEIGYKIQCIFNKQLIVYVDFIVFYVVTSIFCKSNQLFNYIFANKCLYLYR